MGSKKTGAQDLTVQNRKLYLLSIFVGAIALMIPAFINNFPFLFVDSGTYLGNGFSNEVSWVRPLLYGLFIRHTSLAESLWLVIFVQALIVSWTINRVAKTFFPEAHAFFPVLAIAFLTFTSGIGLTTGMLMPDFLTAVMILMVAIFFFADRATFRNLVIPALVLWLALGSHHSHPYILFCILFGLGSIDLLLRIKKRQLIKWPRFFLVVGIGLIGYFTIPYLQYSRTGEFVASKSSNVFLVGRMNQMGLLQPFLEENCTQRQGPYFLCAYEGLLPIDFLWSPDSPVHKDGGWNVNNERYKKVVNGFFKDPLYAKKFIIKSLETVVQQFFTFDLVVITQQKRGEFLHDMFKIVLPEYIPAFENAMQYKEQWSNKIVNSIQRVVVFTCFLLLLYLFLYQDKYTIPSAYRNLFLVVFLGLLANAFICGCISMVDPRFQARVIWILPFFTILLLYHLWTEKQKSIADQ